MRIEPVPEPETAAGAESGIGQGRFRCRSARSGRSQTPVFGQRAQGGVKSGCQAMRARPPTGSTATALNGAGSGLRIEKAENPLTVSELGQSLDMTVPGR